MNELADFQKERALLKLPHVLDYAGYVVSSFAFSKIH